ncbi:PilW family protein [Aromatoleum buckelii]|uniref:Prepilin-type cleavage/methylation domain-containing protein n=1 Tax=Aromatoleum buckelii TaxID=200254 RepID=A0ABX1N751_9RHOO|nr:prepilin-type N-terminal cleavage/methylation domain-containing protein [Aromatoleum buckelii]MCK0511268.1 prepilin-type N-terminal cleavage/methylation domain-containing protein [Aromatoleum buckelii]
MLKPQRSTQKGLSLVELMVGVTVGLVVMTGITTFFVNYLQNNRQLIQMARLDQEMRTAMDIVARDIKRMGYKRDVHLDILNLTQDSSSRAATFPIFLNPQADISGSEIKFWYDENSDDTLDTGATTEQHGYRLDSNTLQRRDGGTWQAITDPNVTQITEFALSRTYRCIDIDGDDPANGGPAVCAGTPPTPSKSHDGAHFVTEIAITMSGQLKADSAVKRTLNERVRVRADIFKGGAAESTPPAT